MQLLIMLANLVTDVAAQRTANIKTQEMGAELATDGEDAPCR